MNPKSPLAVFMIAFLLPAVAPAGETWSGAAAADRCAALTRITSAAGSGLPLPRFVSLRFSEVNLRRGPDQAQMIDWTYTRRRLPVMIIAEHNDWRRVCDQRAVTGWIHVSQLTSQRTVRTVPEQTRMRMRPQEDARSLAEAEAGAILGLRRCRGEWCLVEAEGHAGWMPRQALWGVLAEEEPG